MKNISIKYKLIILTILPLIAAMYLCSEKMYILNKQYHEQKTILDLMAVSISSSQLVHEIQKERGMTAGYINTKGIKFAKELPAQRLETDKKLREFKNIVDLNNNPEMGLEYKNAIKESLAETIQLNDKRLQINAINIPLKDALNYYTTTNKKLLAISREGLFLTQDSTIIRNASAYLYFLLIKENTGIERAVGTSGFSNVWTNETIKKFIEVIEAQEQFKDVFFTFASPTAIELFNSKSKNDIFTKTQELRTKVLTAFKNNMEIEKIDPAVWFQLMTNKIDILKEIEDVLASDIIKKSTDSVASAKILLRNYSIALTLILSIVILMAFIITRDIIFSLLNTKYFINDLARGNLDLAVVGAERKDEIGDVVRSISAFKDNLLEKQKNEQQKIYEIESRRQILNQNIMNDLAKNFEDNVGSLIDTLNMSCQSLNISSKQMKNNTEQSIQSTVEVAKSSEVVSSNISIIAAAMEEMTASSNEIAAHIQNTKTKSQTTAENADKAKNAVNILNKLASTIGEVITSISDIAEQTNLLALNATIEAARAGEAGKGFAIVADEVKALASETAKKTIEIETQISEIQNATSNSVNVMENIIKNVADINEAIIAISAAVEEQNVTNAEIARNVSEASKNAISVSSVIKVVELKVTDLGNSSENLSLESDNLNTLSENLKHSVEDFLKNVRKENPAQTKQKAA